MDTDLATFTPPPGDVILPDGTSLDVSRPLTTDEAEALTDQIRSTADVLYILIARAHAGRAWEALGYGSFAEYVRDEFNMSRSRAYQMLDQHKVQTMLEDALPEGTTLQISEAQARDLKSVISEVVPEVRERTAGLDAEDATDIASEIIEHKRAEAKEAIAAARSAAAGDEEPDYNEAFGAGGGGDHQRGGLPGQFGGGGGGGDDYDDEGYDDGVDEALAKIDPTVIRRQATAAYDVYTVLGCLIGMPDEVEFVIDAITDPARIEQVNVQMAKGMPWFLEFEKAWKATHGDGGTAATDTDVDAAEPAAPAVSDDEQAVPVPDGRW